MSEWIWPAIRLVSLLIAIGLTIWLWATRARCRAERGLVLQIPKGSSAKHWPPPDQLPEVAPGVLGFIRDMVEGPLIIPMVIAKHQGAGDVGRWLDGLAQDRTIIVPAVVSDRLAGMLLRRGFQERDCYAADENEMTDCLVRFRS